MHAHSNSWPLPDNPYPTSQGTLAGGFALPLTSLLAVALLFALSPRDRVPTTVDAMTCSLVPSDSQFWFASGSFTNSPDEQAGLSKSKIQVESAPSKTSIHVKGCVVGRVEDVSPASKDRFLTVVHAFEFLVHGTTEYRDRRGITEVLHFERIWEASLLTPDEHLPIRLGDPDEPLLNALWTPATPHVGARHIAPRSLIQALSKREVAAERVLPNEHALWRVASLSGKTVRLTRDASGDVTSLTPLKCELSKLETDWLRRTSLAGLIQSLAAGSKNPLPVTAASLGTLMPTDMQLRGRVQLLDGLRNQDRSNRRCQQSSFPLGYPRTASGDSSLETDVTATPPSRHSRVHWYEDSHLFETLYPPNVLLDSKFVVRGKARATLVLSHSTTRRTPAANEPASHRQLLSNVHALHGYKMHSL